MIKIVGFNMERFKPHQKLYIRHSDLHDASKESNISYNILGYDFTGTINILQKSN